MARSAEFCRANRFWMITVGAWNSATKLSATVATRQER
jgi:hypothetical protein